MTEALAPDPAAGPAEARVPLAVYAMLAYLAAITIFGKGPTYLPHPPVYWGELTLLAMLAWMYADAYRNGMPRELRLPLGMAVVLFMLVGAAYTLVAVPRWGMDAVRDAAIWYYAIFFFLGAYVAGKPPVADWLWRKLGWVWFFSLVWNLTVWATGSWPVHASPIVPWRGVHVLYGSGSENRMHMSLAAALLVLGWPRLRENIPRKVFVILASCAAAAGLFVSSGRGVKVAILAALAAGLLATLGSRQRVWPTGRIALVSFLLVLGLAVAAIAAGPAGIKRAGRIERFEDVRHAAYQGTTHWRLTWWTAIIKKVHEENPAFGLGFGYNLGRLNCYLGMNWRRRWAIRSPHNYNMSVFGHMGYFGLCLWLLLLFYGLLQLFIRIRRGGRGGRRYTLDRRKELTFWLIMLVATWINSSFGVLMEGPVLGVWFWFALGFATRRSSGPDGFEPVPESEAAQLRLRTENRTSG